MNRMLRTLTWMAVAAGLAGLPALADESLEAAPEPVPTVDAAPPEATAAPEQKVSGEAVKGAPVDATRVPLARFTTAVENKEPVDSVAFLSTAASQIYFYTELRGLTGETVTHRWEHGGKVMAEVSFDVGGPRWRVWSSKQLIPDLVGDWTVSVVNAEGEVLAAETFTYSQIDPGA